MLSFVVLNSLILYHLLDACENDNSVKVQPGLTFLFRRVGRRRFAIIHLFGRELG